MKKLLKMAVALAMAATLGVGISACGGEQEHEHKYDTWDYNETQHWKYCDEHGEDKSNIDESTKADHDFTNGDCVCGARKGGDETQTGKLPEENFEAAWAAAFDETNFDNFKIEGTLYYHFTDVNTVEPEEDSWDVTGIRANGCEHYSQLNIAPEESSELYYDGEWQYSKNEPGEWEAGGKHEIILEMFEELYFGAKDHAADFTFDEEKGLYIWVQTWTDEDEISCTMTLGFSFKDGKIAHFLHDRIERFPNDEEFGGAVVEYRYDLDYTYGGQTVTLPKDLPEVNE